MTDNMEDIDDETDETDAVPVSIGVGDDSQRGGPGTGGVAGYAPVDPLAHNVLERITEPLGKREGFRHLWLGDSGMGKTYANDKLIRWIQERKLVDVTLTIDDKSAHSIQYADSGRLCVLRVNPRHLKEQPPRRGESTQHVIFRGIAATKAAGPEVDGLIFDTFSLAWDLVRLRPCAVLVNVDELADATNGHQSWGREEAPQSYRKGRAVGISIVATTQLPQLLPREAFGLSETIGIFRMTTRELAYLAKYRVIEESDIDQISSLEVGEFRLYQKNHAMDPAVYKFGAG